MEFRIHQINVAYMADECGIQWKSHLWYFLAIIGCSCVKGGVLFDFVYLRVVWQL